MPEGYSIEAASGIIAMTSNPTDEYDRTEESDAIEEANARLIAAAPDQNEALKRIVDAIEEMVDAEDLDITSDVSDLLLQIATIGNKAIAKAEGR